MIFPTQEQLERFRATIGAFSVHEMVGAINVAAQAPYGTCIELGSHRGRSGIAHAIGLSHTPNKVLHMVDPLYDMNNVEAWKHSVQGHPDNAWQGAREPGFNGTVVNTIHVSTGGAVEAELHGDYSEHALPLIADTFGDYSFVFVDSDSHELTMLEVERDLIRPRMKVGGVLAFHDLFSQFLDVEKVYRGMLEGGEFEEISIDWQQIREWVSANGGEETVNSWHHNQNPSPCFYGALKKVK